MKLWKEKAVVVDKAKEIVANDVVKKMREDTQHGDTSTYEHCMNVAALAIYLSRGLGINVDEEQMVVGAMLHDFFLYDWHDGKQKGDRFFDLHCFYHPRKALENARQQFSLTWREENIIRSHMFPTTLLHPPRCKEAWIVCMADKWCAIVETFEGRLRFKTKKKECAR